MQQRELMILDEICSSDNKRVSISFFLVGKKKLRRYILPKKNLGPLLVNCVILKRTAL